MEIAIDSPVVIHSHQLPSTHLSREVTLNVYLPSTDSVKKPVSLLLVNDGQDLEAMGFDKMYAYLNQEAPLKPLMVVGIHCGEERLQEYGMISGPDYKGRGAKAGLYNQFILEELLPFLYRQYAGIQIAEKAFAGFSLGGLSAFDLVWNHPDIFTRVGVFSGSLWWRSKSRTDRDYKESRDRMMHKQVREGDYHPGLKFFFQCGEKDEAEDRNKNGVIDSIDDTIDLMRELYYKGYLEGKDMTYLQSPDGKHDVVSWAKVLPEFLKWGWGC